MAAALKKMSVVTLLVNVLLPAVTLAAGGGDISRLVLVADTRGLNGGLAWMANLYNESHLYFTIFTVVAIPVLGLILGLLADVVMHWIGLDLKSRKLAER